MKCLLIRGHIIMCILVISDVFCTSYYLIPSDDPFCLAQSAVSISPVDPYGIVNLVNIRTVTRYTDNMTGLAVCLNYFMPVGQTVVTPTISYWFFHLLILNGPVGNQQLTVYQQVHANHNPKFADETDIDIDRIDDSKSYPYLIKLSRRYLQFGWKTPSDATNAVRMQLVVAAKFQETSSGLPIAIDMTPLYRAACINHGHWWCSNKTRQCIPMLNRCNGGVECLLMEDAPNSAANDENHCPLTNVRI